MESTRFADCSHSPGLVFDAEKFVSSRSAVARQGVDSVVAPTEPTTVSSHAFLQTLSSAPSDVERIERAEQTNHKRDVQLRLLLKSQAAIDASLEHAKLSIERQGLAKRSEELAERLHEFQ